MHQRLVPLLFLLALLGVAASLAIAINVRNQLVWGEERNAGVSKEDPKDKAVSQDQGVAIKPAAQEISETTCSKAGGAWNECGSLCRGKPAGTMCAEICVPQCECLVGRESCPQGFACISEVASGEGVCRSSGEKTVSNAKVELRAKEFKSADGVTSVVWDDLGAEEGLLMNGFSFYGTSTAFENNLSWRVVEDGGRVVAKGFTYVNSPDAGIPGAFKVMGFYETVPKSASGSLEVYEASAKDGTPIHAARLPVKLVTNTQEVTVYWGNSKKDSEMLDCSKVYPVKHKVVSGAPANWTLAMNELLRGTTAWEKSQGFFTSIPEGVGLPEIIGQQDGRTILDFDEALERGVGGSCRVANIRAQIEATWANFGDNNGNKPIISIDGRTEDILQP